MLDLIRLNHDIADINKLDNVKISFPEKGNITKFIITLKVDAGYYKKKWFRFLFNIPDNWPYVRPQVRILDKIWHPNIEVAEENNLNTGRICIRTLSEYLPSTLLMTIVESLKFLLVNTEPNDPFNVEAGEQELNDPEGFKKKVQSYLKDLPDA